MDRIVYPYRRTFMHAVYLAAGIVSFFSGLPFYCGCLPLGWSMVAALQEDQFFNPAWLVSWIGICGMCAVSLSIVPLSLLIIYLGTARHEAILTADTFTFGFRRFTKTLRLSEIVRVSVRYSWPWNIYPLGILLTDAQNRKLMLPIWRWAAIDFTNNIFDYQKMTGDILQRLPATAVVEEGVRTFAATGKLQ